MGPRRITQSWRASSTCRRDEARALQREATDAVIGCWISHDTDYVHSWAPFSNLPTQYRVSVEGERKWYAQ